MRRILILASAFFLALPSFSFKPPTMGWSTWNTFTLFYDEALLKAQAETMIATGLAKAGYTSINIDDGFTRGRRPDGRLVPNLLKFPHGLRYWTDYLHKKGLKAGIYTDAGHNTCSSGPLYNRWGFGVGFVGHEDLDCHTYFIDWNFDFIKVDFCGGNGLKLDERTQYTKISKAIRSCGKPNVTFNVCRWDFPGTWVTEVADSWRTTCDISCNWPALRNDVHENRYIQAFTGGGHYNDPDMLEIGRGLTPDEENTHMAYWCITSAPLLIGCDMRNIPEHSLRILGNKDLIAMDQDVLGIGAPVVQRKGEVYVFAKDMKVLHGPQRAVVVTNLTDQAETMVLSLDSLGFTGKVKFYDCFTHKTAATVEGSYQVSIPAHGSLAYYATGKRIEKTLYQGEEAWLNAYQEIYPSQWNAHIDDNPFANQGASVSSLGKNPDNYLEWRNVYSNNGGAYEMTIRYACAEPLDMTMTVNGEQEQSMKNLTSNDDTLKFATVKAKVTLKKGYNTVRLANPVNRMPNIDCMSLSALKE